MSDPTLCAWTEKKCIKPSKKDGYCLKHHDRGILLEEAKKKGVRICDDGRRACRNETLNSKLKCQECLQKNRELENALYNERKERGLCVMCGKGIHSLTKGIKEDLVQKCEACYSTMRKVEDNRKRERNYSVEKSLNPERHFREYASGAAKRNIEFNITLDEFTTCVVKPCYYCKAYKETEVRGVDRIDSFKGYSKENILPACETCNSMKKQLSMKEFASHIELLYKNFVSTFSENISEVEESLPSYRLRPSKIVEHYSKRTLAIYIELCRADKRTETYIQKLVDATAYTMTNSEFRNYLENASRTDVRSKQITLTNERKRIPRNEMVALLKNNNHTEVVKLYESVFGATKDIKEDMKELGNIWNTLTGVEQKDRFDDLITKYNNARAYKKKTGASELPQEVDVEEAEIKVITKSIPAPSPIHQPTISQDTIKQWKVSNILSAFESNTQESYKIYLESLEDIKSLPDWETRWKTFSESVVSNKSEAKELIKEFILSLRTIRHNALCYRNNSSILERDDRKVWKNDSILRAFADNKLAAFKEFTENSTGDKADDPLWIKRWESFVESVTKEKEDSVKKEIISTFLNSQRIKKYRNQKAHGTATG